MSDAKRNDNDPAMQVAQDLKARLRAMGGDELIELTAQLLTTYVIEGVVATARAGDSTELAADLAGEETFAQMLKRLKASKRDPVLEKFIIDGENISVRIDGQGIMPVTEYRRPNAPPPAGPGVSIQNAPRREGAPGAAGSIYNRSLYAEQQQAAAPAQQRAAPEPIPMLPNRNAPPPSQPAQQRPAQPAQPAQQQPAQKPGEQRDRFSLIELE